MSANITLSHATTPMQNHLQPRDFNKVLIVAFALHVVVLLAIALWPKPETLKIPVRTLDITLGAPYPAQETRKNITPKAVPKLPEAKAAPSNIQAPSDNSFTPVVAKPKAKTTPKPKPKIVKKKAASKRIKISDRRKPKQQSIPASTKVKLPKAPPRPATIPSAPATTAPTEQLKLSSKPYQYVRSTNEASPAKHVSKAEEETIRARYEQKISSWLEQHRVSSSAAKQLGQHGTAVIRVRLDRSGKVLYYAIDRSSGFQLIDKSAMTMVRRANPFPTAPANYPGSGLMEFLIPVKFSMR